MVASENEKGPAEESDKDKGKARGVAEYLQSPRRKRKAFVVLACKAVPAETENGIANFLRNNYKGVSVAQPKTAEEFTRLTSRQLVLVIFDDEFVELEDGLKLIGELKRKKGTTVVPVLFLSRRTEQLVEAYHQVLLPFHEADDYIDYMKSPPHYIYSKIRAGLLDKNRRRSRRYRVNISLSYFNLTLDRFFPGRIVDLSIHGAMLMAEDQQIFRANDQLKLHIPLHPYLPPVEGDFLKLSARVRRVQISGNQTGVSFEYMSDKQQVLLMRLLTEIVNLQKVRKSAPPAAKGA